MAEAAARYRKESSHNDDGVHRDMIAFIVKLRCQVLSMCIDGHQHVEMTEVATA